MRKQRIEATLDVTKTLIAAELALDRAVEATAQLNASMTSARITAHLSAVVGQTALESATSSLSSLVAARSHLVETHHRLNAVKTDIGMRELCSGDGSIKPGVAQLSVVERAAA